MDIIKSYPAMVPEDEVNLSLNWIYDLFQPENLRHSMSWTIFFILIYTIIFVVGIAGNFIVILVFCKRRQMRSVTNMFIVNLAVADLFVILFCVPVTLISNIFVPWILGTFMCKGVAYIQGISVFASAYSLAVISAERCKGIYRFMPVINHLTKFQALVIIAVIWTTASLILLPWPIVFEVTPIPENGTTLFCIETWSDEFTGNMYFLFGNLISCYAIPGILICFTNSQVWWQVSNPNVPVGSACPRYLTNYDRKVKSGVKKMLSLVTFAFLISWLPLYAVMCRVKFTSIESMSDTELDILDVLIPIVQLLGTSNSCINPVFYAHMNSCFREMFRSVCYISFNCGLACNGKCRPIRNRHRLVENADRRPGNNVCRCRKCNLNCASQNSNSTSSTITQCSCQDGKQIFGVTREVLLYEANQVKVTTHINAKWQKHVLKCSRETSV